MEKAVVIGSVRPEQRAILTTWKISVGRISDEAMQVLRTLSMLGNDPIPEELVNYVLKATNFNDECSLKRRYHQIVLGELVFQSSLVQRCRSSVEDAFDIHRLVRLFIHAEMEEDSSVWRRALHCAIIATHGCVKNALDMSGKSFHDYPGAHTDRQLVFLPHASSIANHIKPNILDCNEHISFKIFDVLGFTGRSLRWVGHFQESISAYQRQLKLLRSIHGKDAKNSLIANIIFQIAFLLYRQGKLNMAEAMHQRCLSMKKSILGEEAVHPNIARSLNDLGIVYDGQGKLEKLKRHIKNVYKCDWQFRRRSNASRYRTLVDKLRISLLWTRKTGKSRCDTSKVSENATENLR